MFFNALYPLYLKGFRAFYVFCPICAGLWEAFLGTFIRFSAGFDRALRNAQRHRPRKNPAAWRIAAPAARLPRRDKNGWLRGCVRPVRSVSLRQRRIPSHSRIADFPAKHRQRYWSDFAIYYPHPKIKDISE